MDPTLELSSEQKELLTASPASKIWLSGLAGSGKTTAAALHLLNLVNKGVPAEQILILAPQRTLAKTYIDIIASTDFPAGGRPDILTLNGLAQRCISLFWPLVSLSAGFKQPQMAPIFLTIETAQYYMSKIVNLLLQQGYFGAITITPHRLYSQLLDNLNKSALVGFPVNEIASRLKSAWIGPGSQIRVYDQAQEAILLFRNYCIENNLLDFSLQVEVFRKHLWPTLLCRQYLTSHYKHVIFDNIEEDTPAAHDLILDWLPDLSGGLFILDEGAGYRKFLGADPISAQRIKVECDQDFRFSASINLPVELKFFQQIFANRLGIIPQEVVTDPEQADPDEAELYNHLKIKSGRYFPQMLDEAADEVSRLVNEQGVPPGQIAILAPFLNDRLRFGLTERLRRKNLASHVMRPSSTLQENSYSACLLTLARLAHPGWPLYVVKADFIAMLNVAIDGLDLCRAGLLADVVYRRNGNIITLGDFNQVKGEVKDRITYLAGERYDQLRQWINLYSADPPIELDIFFSRLFGEQLTQPGFGFHKQIVAGEVTANLMESARKFRQAAQSTVDITLVAKEFVLAVESGLVSAQYVRSWDEPEESCVKIAPAYTFLMQNRPVEVEIWLDIGSNAWFERLEQPLTHPYILSRQWQSGMIWDDPLEFKANQQTLFQLTSGLFNRCTRLVILMYSELNEQGFEQQGVLIKAIFNTLKKIRKLNIQDGKQQTEQSGKGSHV